MPHKILTSCFLHHSSLKWVVVMIGSLKNLRNIYDKIWRNSKKHPGWRKKVCFPRKVYAMLEGRSQGCLACPGVGCTNRSFTRKVVGSPRRKQHWNINQNDTYLWQWTFQALWRHHWFYFWQPYLDRRLVVMVALIQALLSLSNTEYKVHEVSHSNMQLKARGLKWV